MGDGHLPGQDKGRRPGEETEGDEETAHGFKRAGKARNKARQVIRHMGRRRRKVEELVQPMLQIEQIDDDTQNAEDARL
jgi:hypothetical protein